MYAIGTIPLIHSFHNPSRTQVWYGGDASAAVSLCDLLDWFSFLCSHGTVFSYFFKLSKSFVVVGEHCRSEVKVIFRDLGINVVTAGHRYLGGFYQQHASTKCQCSYIKYRLTTG